LLEIIDLDALNHGFGGIEHLSFDSNSGEWEENCWQKAGKKERARVFKFCNPLNIM